MASTEPLLFYSHPETGELFRRRWQLHVADGVDRPRAAQIEETPALIGAAPAATLVLTDDTVSRFHAELDVYSDGLRLRDLDSTNGCFLSGEDRIRHAFIANGGSFRVGRTTIRLLAVDEPAASEIETDPRGVPPGEVEIMGGLSGVASSTRELFRQLRRVAPSSASLLLEGPIGSGKGALAQLVHALSEREDQAFVALAPERGAELSDALLAQAHQGTLYIEEIERLPRAVLERLRLVLERGEIERSGEAPQRIDLRLIASSSNKLAALANADLLRRLAVVRLSVPGLDARREDVPLIAAALLERLRPQVQLGPRARELLLTQRFPKGLRDLEPLLGRLAGPGEVPAAGFERMLAAAFLSDLLEQLEGRLSQAAAALGLSERGLLGRLKALDVDLE